MGIKCCHSARPVDRGPRSLLCVVGVLCWPAVQLVAAGVLKLRSMSMETNWDFRRQGYLSLAKMAVGHDKLRQDCAIEMQAVASGSVVGSPASKTGVISY